VTAHVTSPLSADDEAVVEAQLGRPLRGAVGVGHRCECGDPDVVVTAPRLPDGTPFPTVYYLTCSRLNSAVSTLEAEGTMRRMQDRLTQDAELAENMRAAHAAYLTDREALAVVPEIAGISAGGMPDRVKCLHVMVAHSLAGGPGVNPLGDEALDLLHQRGVVPRQSPCVSREVS
jgi:uncharacterized protein